MSVLVSVVVPVYNVEPYLEECIESIRNQSYENLEIILVDDGSTDNSGQICDAIAREDNRVEVIHQQNQGLGPARNAALETCSGQYVLFVDSDDYIAADTVERCLKTAERYSSDMVFFAVQMVKDGKPIPANWKEWQTGNLSIADCVGGSFCSLSFQVAWARLYARSVFGEERFRAALHEDYDFVLRVLKNVKHPYYLNEKLYFYRQRPGSITQDPLLAKKRCIAKLEGCCVNIKTLFDMCENFFLDQRQMPHLVYFVQEYKKWFPTVPKKDDPCIAYLPWVNDEKRALRKALSRDNYAFLCGVAKHGTAYLRTYERRMRFRGRARHVLHIVKTLWVRSAKRVE